VSIFAQSYLSQRICVAILSFIRKHGKWQKALRELSVAIKGFQRNDAEMISEEDSAQAFVLRLEGKVPEFPSESVAKRKSRKNETHVAETGRKNRARRNGARVSTEMVSTRDLADLTGLSPDYFQKLARSGEIPCLRLGSGPRARFLFERTAFDNWWDTKITKADTWQAGYTKGMKSGGRASAKTGKNSINPLKQEVKQLLRITFSDGRKN
jgi:excisionase family DNA binding protein